MTTFLWVVVGLLVILVIALIVGLVISSGSERALVEKRLGQYIQGDASEPARNADDSALTAWVNKRVEKSSAGDRIARSLARADLKLKVAEYFALIVIFPSSALVSWDGYWAAWSLARSGRSLLSSVGWWVSSCQVSMFAANRQDAS